MVYGTRQNVHKTPELYSRIMLLSMKKKIDMTEWINFLKVVSSLLGASAQVSSLV